MTTEKTVIFTASNHHIEQCGTPPRVNADQPGYHSYFENHYGEQWIFHYDTETEEGWVWGGDKGWESIHRVASTPKTTAVGEMTFVSMAPDLILNTPENLWLAACMQAAEMNKDFRLKKRQEDNTATHGC